MVIYLAVGCKSDTRQGRRTKCYEFPREENLKQQWLIKIKRRNIQSIQQPRMNHAYCVGLNPGRKKMRFQLVLDKTFCSNTQPLTHRQLKQRQRTKINKTMLSTPLTLPSSVFHTEFTISKLKCK